MLRVGISAEDARRAIELLRGYKPVFFFPHVLAKATLEEGLTLSMRTSEHAWVCVRLTEVSIAEPGEVVLPASVVPYLDRAILSGDAHFWRISFTNQWQIEGKGLDPAEFVVPPKSPQEAVVIPQGRELQQLVNRVKFARDVPGYDDIFLCVHVEVEETPEGDRWAWAVACNRVAMAFICTPWEGEVFEVDLPVPIADWKPTWDELEIGPNYVEVRSAEGSVFAPKVNERYPNWKKFRDMQPKEPILTLDGPQFVEALRHIRQGLSALGRRSSSPKVQLTWDKERIWLVLQDDYVEGKVWAYLPAIQETGGDWQTVYMRLDLLERCAKGVQGNIVKFAPTGTTSDAYWLQRGDDGLTVLLMPIKPPE